jgi:RNA polymerase sigma-70 factor (ECF subfamily)
VAEGDGALAAAWAQARRTWPAVDLDQERFFAHVRGHAGDTPPEQLCLTDLYLACACAAGILGAAEALEARYGPELDRLLARLGAAGAHGDEVKQRLRARLLVAAEGAAPKIAHYAGRGDLWRWIKVAATREAISLLRRERRQVNQEDDALEDVVSPAESQELELLKRTYRREFKAAFHETLEELGPRPRTILRYYLIDGLNIDQIGAVYGVHRATAARWIERIREDLLLGTRERLAARIQVGRAELDSIMRLIRSQLDVSIQRILAAGPGE